MQANLGQMFERKAKILCNGGRSVTKNLRVRQQAPKATDVFVDDGNVTTDKKLGLERFQVSVGTKQTLPALICQMQRAEIILHVKRVLLKQVIASPLIEKEQVYF